MDPAPAPAPQIDAQPQIDIGSDDDFSSLRDAIRQAPEANKADPVMDSAKPKPAEKAPKAEEKAEKQVEDKPKSLKDKLKVEEEPVEEEPPTDEVDEDEIPKYKDRVPTEKEKATWKGLKQTKAEYEKLKPEFEKLKAEYEEFKKKPVYDESITKELEELRQFRDMTQVELSDAFKKEVTEPKAAIARDVDEIMAEFKIPKDALGKAFQESSEWKRNLAIEKALKDADEEVPAAIVKTLLDKATELNKIWDREDQFRENASKQKAAYDLEQSQKITKQTLEEQKAWQNAVESSTKMIETQMGPLLKNMPEDQRNELLSALKEANIAETPEDRALQAQAPHLAAVLIEQLNSMKKEMNELKKANKALSAASPSSNGRQQEAKKPAADDDDEGLFKAIRTQYGR